jgi:hypothetical protein
LTEAGRAAGLLATRSCGYRWLDCGRPAARWRGGSTDFGPPWLPVTGAAAPDGGG